MVKQRLQPQVVEEPQPPALPGQGWNHKITWRWNDKEVALESSARSKKLARNEAARVLLQRLIAEEAAVMDPGQNGSLAQWAIEWINSQLDASMEVQEDVDAEQPGRLSYTWSCPQLPGETVSHATAASVADARREAMSSLFRTLPDPVNSLIEDMDRVEKKAGASKHGGMDSRLSGKMIAMQTLAGQRLGINMKNEVSRQGPADFHCVSTWSYYDAQQQIPKSIQAMGVGRSKSAAKAKAGEELMAQLCDFPRLSDEQWLKISEINYALDRSQVREAVEVVQQLLVGPDAMRFESSASSSIAWGFFLPQVLEAVLADGDKQAVRDVLGWLQQALPEGAGVSADLWEALLNEAAFAMRHFFVAHIALEELGRLPLDAGSFAGHLELDYFRRFRHLLALERHGGIIQGIQHFEFEPNALCSVPTVDVHAMQADLVMLTSTPESAIVELLDGARSLRPTDIVLLVPMEAVADSPLAADDMAGNWQQGQGSNTFWQHPEAWLGSVTSMKGNPRVGEEVFIQTRQISRFGSDAEGAREDGKRSPITLGRQYRMFFLAMETPLSRMMAALRCLCGVQLPPWSENYEGRKSSFVFQQAIKEVVVAEPGPAVEAASQPPRTSMECQAPDVMMQSLLQRQGFNALTESQRQAVRRSLEDRVSLIQGPPGTGKTHVACAIIAAWVERYVPHGDRILAVADSNVAADNIYSRLRSWGVESVRVGSSKELDVPLTGEALWKAAKQARVVVATCIGSGMDALDGKDGAGEFQRVVIDECTQACEPTALVAMGRRCEQLVLIGDHKQLPATVLSKYAQRDGLGISIFERLIEVGVSPTVLLEQRRMHSSMAEFPNRAFYGGVLQNATDDADLPPVQGFKFPSPDCRVCFVDTSDLSGGNEGKRGFSAFNAGEAKAVAQVVCSMLNAGMHPKDLGILSAYVAQRNEIRNALADAGLRYVLPQLSIETIDGYQGMERDVILFSATRSNPEGSLGFVADPRRMNVMMTRGRRGLVVFGDGTTLRQSHALDSHWADWIHWVIEKQAIILPGQLDAALGSSAPAAETHTSATPQTHWGTHDSQEPFLREPHDFQRQQPVHEQRQQQQPPLSSTSQAAQDSWTKVYSQEHNLHYYWNRTNNVTQWEVPPGFDA